MSVSVYMRVYVCACVFISVRFCLRSLFLFNFGLNLSIKSFSFVRSSMW